jgi:hypothetical protein
LRDWLLLSSCGLLFLGFSPKDPIAVRFLIVGGLLLLGAVALIWSLIKSAKGTTAAPHPDDIPPAN